MLQAQQAQAGRRHGRAGRWAWARRALGVGARGARRGRPGRAAWACGAPWARGLATGYALGLFSIRFDSVLFLSRFLDIVREPGSWTLFVNPVHEHCSSQLFFAKTNILNLIKIKSNQIKFDKIFEK